MSTGAAPPLRPPLVLAVMQPYLFPYIGYFQLVAAADRFVFYDDVAYIRNGWINRNRWMLAGRVGYFTVPLQHASSFRSICEVQVAEAGPWRRKLLESLHQHYGGAPHHAAVAPLFESVVGTVHPSIGAMARASVQAVAGYLGLATRFVDSAAVYGNAHLRGSERVLDICRRECATAYLNLPSGRNLYRAEDFARHGVALHFIEPDAFTYPRPGGAFVPDLSIIDVLMHCPREQVRARLLGGAGSGGSP